MRYEWIGILGSMFVIAAFMCRDEKKIRILDTVGAVLFILYGVSIGSLSMVLLNTVLSLIQLHEIASM